MENYFKKSVKAQKTIEFMQMIAKSLNENADDMDYIADLEMIESRCKDLRNAYGDSVEYDNMEYADMRLRG